MSTVTPVTTGAVTSGTLCTVIVVGQPAAAAAALSGRAALPTTSTASARYHHHAPASIIGSHTITHWYVPLNAVPPTRVPPHVRYWLPLGL